MSKSYEPQYYLNMIEKERHVREKADNEIIDLLHDVKTRYENKLSSYMAKGGPKVANGDTTQNNNKNKNKSKSSTPTQQQTQSNDGWGNDNSNDNQQSEETQATTGDGWGNSTEPAGDGWGNSTEPAEDGWGNNTQPAEENWGADPEPAEVGDKNQNNKKNKGKNKGKSSTPAQQQTQSNNGWGNDNNNSTKQPEKSQASNGDSWGNSTEPAEDGWGNNTQPAEENWGADPEPAEVGDKNQNNKKNKGKNKGKSSTPAQQQTQSNNGWGNDNNNSTKQPEKSQASNGEGWGSVTAPAPPAQPLTSTSAQATKDQDARSSPLSSQVDKQQNLSISDIRSQLWTAKLDLRLLEREKSKLDNEVVNLKTERDSMIKKLAQANQELDTSKVKMKGFTVDLLSANEEIHKLNDRIDELEAERRNRYNDVSVTESKRRGLESKLKAYQQQIADLQSDLSIIREERDEFQKTSLELSQRNERLENDLNHSRTLIRTLKDGCALVENQAKTFEMRHDTVIMSKADLERELIAIKEESSRHITAINKLQKSNEQISKAFIQSVEAHEACKKEVEKLHQEYSRKLSGYNIENIRLVEANKQLRKVIDHLQNKR